MQPRNPINGLLAPQGLVQLFAGYQTRPNSVDAGGGQVERQGGYIYVSGRARGQGEKTLYGHKQKARDYDVSV
jgi:hypothetical protein